MESTRPGFLVIEKLLHRGPSGLALWNWNIDLWLHVADISYYQCKENPGDALNDVMTRYIKDLIGVIRLRIAERALSRPRLVAQFSTMSFEEVADLTEKMARIQLAGQRIFSEIAAVSAEQVDEFINNGVATLESYLPPEGYNGPRHSIWKHIGDGVV